jgi:hypothetical protein
MSRTVKIDPIETNAEIFCKWLQRQARGGEFAADNGKWLVGAMDCIHGSDGTFHLTMRGRWIDNEMRDSGVESALIRFTVSPLARERIEAEAECVHDHPAIVGGCFMKLLWEILERWPRALDSEFAQNGLSLDDPVHSLYHVAHPNTDGVLSLLFQMLIQSERRLPNSAATSAAESPQQVVNYGEIGIVMQVQGDNTVGGDVVGGDKITNKTDVKMADKPTID